MIQPEIGFYIKGQAGYNESEKKQLECFAHQDIAPEKITPQLKQTKDENKDNRYKQ